jgi:Zn-finger nucleic acid-binding protein
MSERDPLGEKIRLKERAEEDQYFAQRDRELIEKIKHTREVEHESVIREFARARCPQCGERLRQRSVHGEMIDECPSCQGIWLPKTKLDLVAQQGGEWMRKFAAGLVHLLEPSHEQKGRS